MKVIQAFCEIKFKDDIKYEKCIYQLVQIKSKLEKYYPDDKLELSKNSFRLESENQERFCAFLDKRIVIVDSSTSEFTQFAEYLKDVIYTLLDEKIITEITRVGVRYVLGKEEDSIDVINDKLNDSLVKYKNIENTYGNIVNCGIKFTTSINNHNVNISIAPGQTGSIHISLENGETSQEMNYIIAYDVDSYIQDNEQIDNEQIKTFVSGIEVEYTELTDKFMRILGE